MTINLKITILFLFVSILLNAQNLEQVDDFLKQGNYKLALNLLGKVENKSFENLEKIGDIYQKIGNYGKAILYFEKALQIKPSISTKEKLGKAYQNIGNPNKAIKLFEKILEKNPTNYLLKYHLAKLFFAKKKFLKSEILLHNLISNDKTNPNYYYYLGNVFNNIDSIIKAKIQYKNVLKFDENHLKTHYKLATIYRKEKNIDSTNYYLKKGLKINANYTILLQLNSKVAYKGKNYPEVIKSVKKLDSLMVSSKFYKHLQGFSYYHTFQYEKAEKILLKLLLTKQADEKTLFYLGLTHKALKNFDQATYYFLLSIQQQTPQLSQHYYQLGLIAIANEKPKIAIKYFKKSIEEKQYNPDALYQLATLSEDYYKDKKIALELYKKYLNMFEGHHKQRALYVKQQIKKINTLLFYKNE